MRAQLEQKAEEYFQEHLGVSFDALLAPIDATMPTGKPVRGNGVYSAIELARRQDDPSLPLGAWEHDLKRADWDKVGAIAVDALLRKSKDLQIAGWLLESQINKTGFAGIAPCMALIEALCERYWDELHPQAENGDLEYRANIIHWINEKLLPALRMVPLTATGRERDYNWADWELARRNEQLRASTAHRDNVQVEGLATSDVMSAVNATGSDVYTRQHQMLTEALAAIDMLAATMDRLFGKEAPSLTTLAGLLEQIMSLAESELHKRGVQTTVQPEMPDEMSASDLPVALDGEDMPPAVSSGTIRDRNEAYARLNEVADFLMRLEPHSPAPYLVKRATEWGRLNTVELYQELFLKLGGQLNIFEMLGLESRAQAEHAG